MQKFFKVSFKKVVKHRSISHLFVNENCCSITLISFNVVHPIIVVFSVNDLSLVLYSEYFVFESWMVAVEWCDEALVSPHPFLVSVSVLLQLNQGKISYSINCVNRKAQGFQWVVYSFFLLPSRVFVECLVRRYLSRFT